MNNQLKKFIDQNTNYLLFCFFITLSYLIFAHSLYFDFFIFDDPSNIINNPRVANVSFSHFLWFWKNSLTPIIFNVWQAISFMFGTSSAWPYRIISIITHGINAFIVYQLSLLILNLFKLDFKRNIAFLTSLIFLIHPVVIESVVWPSSLRTTLTTCFAFLFFFYFLKNNFRLNYLSIFFFMASILTNPISGGIIFVIPISWIIFQNTQELDKKDAFSDIFFLSIFLAIFFYLHSKNVLSFHYFHYFDLSSRLKLIIISLCKYIENLTFPLTLSFAYLITPDFASSLSWKNIIFPLFGIILFFTTPYLKIFRLNFRFVLFVQLLFIAFLIPNLGVFLHDFNNLSVVADRYSYLSLFPLALLLATSLSKIFEKTKRGAILSCVILLFILISINLRQTYSWKNSPTILSENFDMLIISGVEAERTFHPEIAEAVFFKASKLIPSSSEPYAHLFHLYKNYGNRAKIRSFLERFKFFDSLIPAYSYLDVAEVYYLVDDFNYSQRYLDEYLNQYPASPETNALQEKLNKSFKEAENYYLYQVLINYSNKLNGNDKILRQLFDKIESSSPYKQKAAELLHD